MPLTIHAAWLSTNGVASDERLFLWAEESGLELPALHSPITEPTPNGSDPRPVNGRGRISQIPSHPRQISAGRLRQILADLAGSAVTQAARPTNATCWLPALDGLPLVRAHTTRLLSNSEDSEPAPTLSVWQISGVSIPPLAALDLLVHLESRPDAERRHLDRGMDSGSDPTSLFRHLRFGNGLLFWSNVAKLALELLVNQHYLPALTLGPTGSFQAIWRPSIVDDFHHRRLQVLIQTMPPICRAYDLAAPAHALGPDVLIERFLASMVDSAVRAWLGEVKHSQAQTVPQSPAGAWLAALISPDPQVILPPQPVYQLYQEWRIWADQLYATNDANFRVCLELVAPAQGDLAGVTGDVKEASQPWQLRYYLQSRDDLHLLVPARRVWQEPTGVMHFQNRRFDQPQERLLAGLGIASRMFDPIRRSLSGPQPEFALLSTPEAHQFLRETSPLLESSGFGVIRPDWWNNRHRTRLNLKLRLSAQGPDGPPATMSESLGPSLLNWSAILYQWQLTLGERAVSQKEFDQLTDLQSPLVYLDGQWVELDPGQVESARHFMRAHPASGRLGLLQAIQLAQGSMADAFSETGVTEDGYGRDDLDGLLLDTVALDGWLGDVLSRLQDQSVLTSLPEPPGFQGSLRPYQRRGVGWLWYLRQLGLGACLADDMGLGKTIQAIALLLTARQQQVAANGRGKRLTTLLICPTSVVTNWRREVERFAPDLRCLLYHGSGRLGGEEFLTAISDYDMVITSYGTARRDIDLLTQITWDDLILDEAQNIKNPGAKQTQAIRRLPARNRVALTGTPVENRLLELWTIMEFLNPGYLGPREQFRRRYIVPIERYNDGEVANQLRRLVQPFLLRRVKTDPAIIPDLPDKNEMDVYCEMTAEQVQLYKQVLTETMDELERSEGIQRRGLILGLLTRLKQITNHPAHFLKDGSSLPGRSGKLIRLAEMLEEALSVGDRALIFTQFVEMGRLLQSHLQESLGVETLFLHGGTPAARRDRMVQEFQKEEGGPAIFILSLRAGGVGLNLTRANHVFHFDRWWNPAVENQATDRAFRIGQTRNVQVYKFIMAGTLEERIHEMILSKSSLSENVIGSGEEWLTELDTAQLRDLLTLRQEEELLA